MTFFYSPKSSKEFRRQLRANMTAPENRLWQYLRTRPLGDLKFRRQFGVGPYVLDFYRPKLHLGIEVDGDSHYQANQQANDQSRAEYLKTFGIRLLRFTNAEVMQNLEGVVELVRRAVEGPPQALDAEPRDLP